MSPILLGLALVLAPTDSKPPARYPEPLLLWEASDLPKIALALSPLHIYILDARGKGKYLDGHVPGAVWIDAQAWAHAFAAGQDEADWKKIIAPLGITPTDFIVVYDDNQSKDAARIWYILRYWGFDRVSLLNGGWKAWVAADGKTEKEPPHVAPFNDLKLRRNPAGWRPKRSCSTC